MNRVRVGLAALLVLALIAGFAAAVTFVPVGYLLPTQHGIYHAPSNVQMVPLTVGNTTLNLSGTGAWYAIGFQLNVSTTPGDVIFLNVSGGQGHLDLYNLSANELTAVQANQTFLPSGSWLNVTSQSIELASYVYGAYYFLFMDVGSTALSVTYNLNVIALG